MADNIVYCCFTLPKNYLLLAQNVITKNEMLQNKHLLDFLEALKNVLTYRDVSTLFINDVLYVLI